MTREKTRFWYTNKRQRNIRQNRIQFVPRVKKMTNREYGYSLFDTKEYLGEWVLIDDCKVVAHGKLGSKIPIIKQKGDEVPFLMTLWENKSGVMLY